MDVISAGALARLIVSVVVIVVALLGVKRWADRSGSRQRGGVRVLSRVPVARGAAVALVEVGRRHYLLGAGEQGVTLIDRLDGDDLEALGLGASHDAAGARQGAIRRPRCLTPAPGPASSRPLHGVASVARLGSTLPPHGVASVARLGSSPRPS